MESKASVNNPLAAKAKTWLQEAAILLWSKTGFDAQTGSFAEGITFAGEVETVPRRAMVQARQIYSFFIADKNGAGNNLKKIIEQATAQLLARYSLPSGAFRHSVDRDGKPVEAQSELYTQAFILFGLAHAYRLSRDEKIKTRAQALLKYLQKERHAKNGGYTEWSKTGDRFLSNPHMHLFEAALAWMAVDKAPEWRALGDELVELCRGKFIQAGSGILAEYFSEDWRPQMENGRFIFEPGHHFEWAWLLMVYEDLTGVDLAQTYRRLYEIGDSYGLTADRKVVIDEVWSDYQPKKKSARYWPQCERAKAALQLAKRSQGKEREALTTAADTAIATVFRYLDAPLKGHCFDALLESGEFNKTPPKASFFYHVANALDEYIAIRPTL